MTVHKAINDALLREDKWLCPVCDHVNPIEKRECEECEYEKPRTGTPEDGL